MKSIYQNKEFATFWNKRVGKDGEDYKRFILDPLMLGYLGSLENKDILELGCGNGYMGSNFLNLKPSSILLTDISEENLNFAKENNTSPKIKLLQLDATSQFPFENDSIDVIYSNMMLNEIETITGTLAESYRVLKTGGVFIFSVLHPTFLLFHFAQEKMGSSKKFVGLEGYFSDKMCKYLMGAVSTTKSAVRQNTSKNFEVEQKIRTLADYFNSLIKVGYTVKGVFEPELSKEILKYNPGFAKYKDVPIGLIFACHK